MQFLILIGILLSTFSVQAETHTQSLADEMTILTRSLDLLLAKEEMKDSLVLKSLQEVTNRTAKNSVIEKKVALLTSDSQSENCLISHKEIKSPDGSTSDATIDYSGPNCPIKISGNIHIQASQMGSDAKTLLVFEIISPALKAELDLEKLEMPIDLKVTMNMTDKGFSMDSKMFISAQLHSQKLGPVSWKAQFDTHLAFKDTGISTKVIEDESYESAGQKANFLTLIEAENSIQKEVYSINGANVSKAEFEKQHRSVSLPGFDQKPEDLARKHQCEIRTYDSAKYTLDFVRKSIKENNTAALVIKEKLNPIFLLQTGKEKIKAFQGLDLEISTTPDAARFLFKKNSVNGTQDEELGKLTYVLNEKADLTKVIMTIPNRIVHITCLPK